MGHIGAKIVSPTFNETAAKSHRSLPTKN